MDQISQQAYHAMNKPVINLNHYHDLRKIAHDANKNQIMIVSLELEKLIAIQKLEEKHYIKNSSRDNCYGDVRPVLTKQLQESLLMMNKLKQLLTILF